MIRRALLVTLALVAVSCSGDDDDEAATTTTAAETTTTTAAPVYDGHVSDVYGDDAAWLCRPDVDDVCDDGLDATAIEADGTTSPAPFVAAEDPAIDCFYVYPTISRDQSDNSDMTPGASEELYVVHQQAARLGEVCRVFVPVYRSTTLTALDVLDSVVVRGAGPDVREIVYGDVLDAWQHYIDNDNDGRGVIIIGHSQGAGLLGRLLAEEIDPSSALRARLVSAMLLGSTAHASKVPNLHVCASDDDTGCVISYATFRSTSPPPANSFFARPDGDEPAICTNPAALAGGSADLHPYFGAGGTILGGGDPAAWGAEVDTPFVTTPGLVSGECVERDGFHYLEVTVHADPGPRVDDIRGDLTPEWGLHLIDVNVTMGDLVEVARTQAEAYTSG